MLAEEVDYVVVEFCLGTEPQQRQIKTLSAFEKACNVVMVGCDSVKSSEHPLSQMTDDGCRTLVRGISDPGAVAQGR